MTVLELDNSLLRHAVKAYDFQERNAMEDYENLRETLKKKSGWGLAANQVGIDAKFFVFGVDEIDPMFNPRIVEQSEETEIGEEGCLSYPDLFMKIKRPKKVRVVWQDLGQKWRNQEFSGMTARIIMHEIDHLNGVLFFDGASNLKKSRSLDAARKARRRYVLNDLK